MWTRNYKNILHTKITVANHGNKSSSPGDFGGNEYFFNFKAPNGSIREIGTYNAHSSYADTTGGYFVDRSDVFSLSSYISLVTNFNGDVVTTNGYTIYCGVGSGTTAPTELDYKLESVITSVTGSNSTAFPTLNTDGTYTIKYSIKVNASADITISEIGLFLPVSSWTSNSSSGTENDYNYYALINRMVLDESISVANGDSATISFSITTPKITFGE